MSNQSNTQILENIQEGLQEMENKVDRYCELLEELSSEHLDQVKELQRILRLINK